MSVSAPEHERFYAFALYPDGLEGKRIPLAIWNGIKDYSNIPNEHIIEATYGKVGIIQTKYAHSRETIEALAAQFDCVIIWTKDRETYRSLVERLRAESDGMRQ